VVALFILFVVGVDLTIFFFFVALVLIVVILVRL
jgi:hypothetical protein